MKKLLLILAIMAIPVNLLSHRPNRPSCSHITYQCTGTDPNGFYNTCQNTIKSPTWWDMRKGNCRGNWSTQKKQCENACPHWDFSNGSASRPD